MCGGLGVFSLSRVRHCAACPGFVGRLRDGSPSGFAGREAPEPEPESLTTVSSRSQEFSSSSADDRDVTRWCWRRGILVSASRLCELEVRLCELEVRLCQFGALR